MDYEKKYKEALANARQEYTTTENVERKQWLEELFPELAESEDEKIRRNIIAALKGEGYYDCDLTNECIAWVEKQGEQNPTWSDEDEKMSENILSHLREYYVQKKGYPYVADLNSPEMEEFRWLKSLKDRMKGREDKQ